MKISAENWEISRDMTARGIQHIFCAHCGTPSPNPDDPRKEYCQWCEAVVDVPEPPPTDQ